MNPSAPDTTDAFTPLIWELDDSKVLTFESDHVQSRMDVRSPNALLLEYTRIMMGFLLHQSAPQSIAMVGLGGGSLAKFCHRYLPHSRITVVEISLEVIALRDAFAIPPDSERFSVLQVDGAEFCRYNDTPFDVVLLDVFDATGVPPVLVTEQVYGDLHQSLHPGGVREWSEQVEHRPDGKCATHRNDVFERGMVVRREHEAHTGAFDACGDGVRGEIDARAERFEHVGAAAPRCRRSVAVLGDRCACSRRHESRCGGHVERRCATARAARVDKLHPWHADRRGMGANGCGKTGDLPRGLAFCPKRDEKRTDLDRVDGSGHDQ